VAAPSLLYPYTLGMMAAVNPCGFPLLPAYLELFVGSSDRDAADPPAARAGRAVTAGAFATVGFLALFGPLGLLTQFGWTALAGHSASVSRYVMAALGVAMVGLGVLTLARRSVKLPLPELGTGIGLRRPVGLVVFGFSYGVASIGCALPLFIGGVAAGFGHATSVRAVSGLLVYGLGMGTILAALAIGIALLGRRAGRHLRTVSRWVPVVGGAILVAVGAYLTWYWILDIVSPGRSFALQRLVNRIQLDISNPIANHARLVGVVLGLVVVGAVVAGGVTRPARPGRPPRRSEPAPRPAAPSAPSAHHPAS
jgi:cytochrome c-type biogenesis protein